MAETDLEKQRAEEMARKRALIEEERHQRIFMQENEDKKKRKEDEALFILYKSESETRVQKEGQSQSQRIVQQDTSSLAQKIIYSDIAAVFGNIRLSHDELQQLLRQLDLLQIETKRRALHEVVKCTKVETFRKIWNVWSRSAGTTASPSVIEIGFKYYEYVGVLCTWQKKEQMIDRYPGGYDEYTMCSLWSIYSDGKMYEKMEGGRHIRRDLRKDAKTRMMKQLSAEHTELLVEYLICYPLSHYKAMYTFQNYGAQIAEFYALNTALYQYDRYKLG
eukprot:368663_1